MSNDTVGEGFVRTEQVAHRFMAVVACHLFSHPPPKILNRVEVGTIGRQGDEGETQFGGGMLNTVGSVPRGAILDDQNWARLTLQPWPKRPRIGRVVKELNRKFFVAAALLPDKTLSGAEIVGAKQVEAILQSCKKPEGVQGCLHRRLPTTLRADRPTSGPIFPYPLVPSLLHHFTIISL